MSPVPIALALHQRLQLALLRGGMALGRGIVSLRGRGHGLSVERFRYGTHRLECGDLLESLESQGAGGAGVTPGRPGTPVVYVHGGGWVAGHRALYTRDLAFLVHAGRPVANLDYPLAPEAPYPAPLRALLSALAHLRAEDPRFARVHLMGDSAGGNLVVMLALLLEDRSRLGDLAPGLDSDTHPEIASVVSLYGVLDRLSWLQHGFPMARMMLRAYGGDGAFEPEVGPELALTPVDLHVESGPPMWIATGDRDRLAESSRIGAAHLERAGVRVHLETYEGQSHGFFNRPGRRESQRLRAHVRRFFDDVDRASPTAEPVVSSAAG